MAHEGAEFGVTANCIVPVAETRLAEGRDKTGFPPWGPEVVAPAFGWLTHESCAASGELFIAVAGRMAKAYVSETPGAFQPHWTAEDIAARMFDISARHEPVTLSPLPGGFYDHLGLSFSMARSG